MRALRHVAGQAVGVVLAALAIASCSSARAREAVFNVQPPQMQLSPGESAKVLIRGGTPPYVPVVVGSGNRLSVSQPTVDNMGSLATITVDMNAPRNTRHLAYFYDRAGASRQVAVDVRPSDLAVKPITTRPVFPDRVFVLGRDDIAAFSVVGGTPPYTSRGPLGDESRAALIVVPGSDAPLPDDQPFIHVKPTPTARPGTYTVGVRDKGAGKAEFSIKFVSKLGIVSAADGSVTTDGKLTMKVGDRASFFVEGGQTPYQPPTVSPVNPDSPTVTTSRSNERIVEIDARQAKAGTYTVNIRDSSGQDASIAIAVEAKPVKPEPALTTPGRPPAKATITKVQEELKSRGFDPKKIDGLMGPDTRTAIQGFQRAMKLLPALGELNPETLRELGVK